MTDCAPKSAPSSTWWRRFSLLMLFAVVFPLSLAIVACQQASNLPGRAANTPFRFISWGDTQTGASTLSALSVQAAALQPAFTLFVGDLEAKGFTQAGMDAWKAAMNGGATNGLFERTLPVRGNWDVLNGDTAGWQAYFKTGSLVAHVGGTNYSALTESLTYSFDYGNSLFIGVDVPGRALLITPAQMAWVDRDLQAAEGRGLRHAFLYFHVPIYFVLKGCTSRTCPTEANTASFIKVLNKHPIVSAIFNGHNHTYAYVHVDHTRLPEVTHPFEEFVTGDTGAAPPSCPNPKRFDYCMASYGFVAVEVSGSDWTVKFYPQGRKTPAQVYTFHQ